MMPNPIGQAQSTPTLAPYVEFRDIETTEVKYNEEALEWHRRELENIQVYLNQMNE